MLRRSCSNCHFCNIYRPSDITLADFWGWEKVVPDANKDDKGLSLVILNTPKGQELWSEIQKDLFFWPVAIEDCMQPNLLHPSKEHPERDAFEDLYTHSGFMAIYKKYGDYGWKFLLMSRIKMLKHFIKRTFKR